MIHFTTEFAQRKQASILDWQCGDATLSNTFMRHIILANPKDVLYILSQTKDAYKNMPWLKWAMELQFIGQGGLTYSENCFDRERFERIRELSAEDYEFKIRIVARHCTRTILQ